MGLISTQIVSALNNYSTIAPIMAKDVVENGGRTAMAYCSSGEKTRKYETREKFIDANMSSLCWFGSIPLANFVFDQTAFKMAGLNPKVSLAYLKKGESAQNIENILKRIEEKKLPGKIKDKNGNIIDIKSKLEKVAKNPDKFKKLLVSRMFTSLAFAIFVSAIVLPKSIIELTKFFIKRDNKKSDMKNNISNQNISFGSLGNSIFNKAITAQNSALEGMAAMDIAISSGRVYYTNKREQEAYKASGCEPKTKFAAGIEKLIREAGAFYLIYFGGAHIKYVIDKFTKNQLDPIIIEDKNYINELKNGAFSQNPIKNLSAEEALDYIDYNIRNDKNVFIKYAKKLGWLETATNIEGKIVRNPFKYVNIDNLKKNFDIIADNSKEFLKQGSDNLEKFIAKKVKDKRIGIFANLIASSFAVCYVLPKIMYTFRKLYTKTDNDPGINAVLNEVKNNKIN